MFKRNSSRDFLMIEQNGTPLKFPVPQNIFNLLSMIRDNAAWLLSNDPRIECSEDAARALEKSGIAKFQREGDIDGQAQSDRRREDDY